jgi:PKD repeat protein
MDRDDFYKFPVKQGQEVIVWMSTKNGIISMILYDTNMLNVDRATYDDTDDPPVTVSWTPTKDGFFYLKLSNQYAIGVTYSLVISGIEWPEPANEPPTASYIWYMEDTKLRVNSTSTDDGSIAEYYWYFDEERLEGSSDWQWWYWDGLSNGVYNVTLVVEDNQGAKSTSYSDFVEIDLEEPERPVAVIDYWINEDNVLITANRSTVMEDIDLFNWWRDDELKEETDWVSWYLDEPVVGIYNITLVVVDYDGVPSEPVTALINVTNEHLNNEAPVAIFEWYVEENTLYVNASESTDDQEVIAYFWMVDDELVTNETDWDSWYWEEPEPGSHEISLMVGDNLAALSDIVTETITIEEPEVPNQAPEATFDWYVRDGTLYVDGSESSDSDGEIVEYIWYIDGARDSSIDSESWSWDEIAEGDYGVTLEVRDNEGAEDTYRSTISVEEDEPEPAFGIPGYPLASIMAGLATLVYMRRRESFISHGE